MKRTTKQLLCVLLAVVMTVGLLPASAFGARIQEEVAEAPSGEEAVSAALAEQPAEPLDTDEPARLAAGDLTIPGYTRVTSLPAGGLSGKYLLVAPYNGDYYMIYPGATGGGQNVKNAAKLAVGSDGTATGYKVNVPSYDDAEAKTDFSAAENTIAKRGESNDRGELYSATAVGPNGEPYYLCKKDTSGNTGAIYQTNCESAFTVHDSTNTGYFKFRHQVGTGSYLMFYTDHMNFNQAGGPPDNSDFMIFERDPVTIPGYNQVTGLDQVNAVTDKTKFLIVAEGKTGLYALYPRLSNGVTAGALPTPAGTYGLRCAKLTVSGQMVTATAAASQGATSLGTAISDITDLHLTIAAVSGGYTFTSTANGNVKLNLDGSMFGDTATALTMAISDGELNIHNGTSRYLRFSESGTGYKWNDSCGTDFWGPGTSNTGAPVYLFYQGELPAATVTPGTALVNMLSGDQIGGASGSADPTGQNSWVFTGGRAAQGSFADVAGARTWAGHFEEWVRYTHAKQLQPSGESTTPYFQRHVINAAYDGQTLKNIVDSFDTRIAPLKPRAVVYLVDENGNRAENFATNLNSLIDKALALRGGTGMIVIATLTQADKTAADGVVDALDEGLKPRVLPMLVTLTDAQKTDGNPNAQGHLAMAMALADAVAGSNVSAADRWPFTLSGSNFTENWPTKDTVTATHSFEAPDTSTGPRKAIKDKVDATGTPMTWLFMGDSITHGSAWTGGYDSLAQLFEKFVKDDLNRKQDIVINAGSSGADTASTITDLDRRLTKYTPDVVVLMLGTNNSGVGDEGYQANLRTILNAIIAKGAVPVLRTPPPAIRSGYDHIATRTNLIKAVAAEEAYAGKVILVDQYTAWTNSNWRDAFTTARDSLHPDEAGHLWFAHQLINEMGLWNDNAEICKLEYVAREATVSPESLTIDGYTKVSALPDDGLELGYYLFVAQCGSDYYMLYPGATGAGETGNNAAKLVLNTTTGKATGYIPRGAVAVGSAYGGSAATDFSKADNLVALDGKYTYESAPSYQVTARENGYVLFDAANPTQYSAAGVEGAAYVSRNSDGTFIIRNNGNNHAALHFYTTHMNFNQSGGTPANCSFLLFKSDTLPPVPLAELEAMIATAKAKTQSDYTSASWASLTSAVDAAEAVVADEQQKADYTAVSTALKNLRSAVNGLQEKPQYPQVPSGATVKELDQLKPAPQTGLSQPFPSVGGVIGGEAGNDSYRIPGVTTVKGGDHAGRLVAATDIRWRDFKDSSNIDTAVSWSDDNGVTWNTSIVNYFGDSSNPATDNRTAIFIDPLITADNEGNLFLVTNAFPAGTCTHGSRNQPLAQSTGFADITLAGDNDRVVTSRMTIYTDFHTDVQTDSNYSYYLGEFGADGYADILDAYNGSASGYYADRHFYLYYQKGAQKAPATDKIYCAQLDDANTWVQQNLFFQNATLHVRTCQFIYLVKSTDGGVTWSDPVILNPQLRTTNETFYGPGPGAGICLSDGTLIVPMYDNGGGEHATCMYSKDGGATWKRGTRLDFGSESCIIPIDATTLRQFYRDNTTTIHYNDRTLENGDWVPGDQQSAPGAPKQGNNQLSALRYSSKVNGKDIILVSTATSPGTAGGYQRKGGKIYAFALKSDKTMELVSTYVVNQPGDWYGYSSLTELSNGDIGLIYENSQTDGNDANSPGYCGLTYRTIPITDIIESEDQSISLDHNEAQLFTNAAGGATTIQLTATLTPDGRIDWSSSNEKVATVVDGLVTAKGDGTAIITAASNTDASVFATCTVTVSTKVERITVKKDGADIGSTPVKVYTNADREGHSVTLTADTTPTAVTRPQLDWTRPDGAKGQLTLSDRGENGCSITITAVPGERNVGEVEVQVASAEHPEVKTTFTVHVIRYLENDVSISIRGVNDPTKTPQFGQTLEADINDLQMTDAGKQALTYQWKRNGTAISGDAAKSKTYILTQEDIGATISVDVTAGANSFYEGTRSATRAQKVELADGPLTGPQNLTGTAPSGAGVADGSISGFGSDYALYEYRLMVTDGVENEWADVTAATIENLAAGTYQVRAKETTTTKAGGFSVVTVPTAGTTTYAITLDAMTNGRVSRSASVAAATDVVTLTVLPETGYKLTADGLTVEKADGSTVSVTRVTGRENEYTFSMPGEAVTVKATFEQLMFTVTHELTNLHCSRGAAEGHQVAYGESTAVTLVPDEGYMLPLRKDITITNSRGVVVTGWTISDDGTITITGGVTSDLNIVAVGRPATHTVNYTLTNGLAKAAETATQVGHMAAYTGVLEAEAGYTLPESIVVTVDGSLIGADNYLYNCETGEISISEGKITGNVVITAVGVKTGDEVVTVTGVTLNRTEASVTVGGTLSLTATVSPENATTKDVVWSSSDIAVATVDENGKITGVAEGEAVITVMTLDGRKSATCTVTVTEATSPSRPSTGGSASSGSTTTETKEDGTKVTTETKPDGTKVETTETPEGDKSVVETKPDGSKTQTVEQVDGTKSELVATKDGDVTITVTDPEGEELVKTEIPATIPEPETKFEDVDAAPWAEEAIDKMAGLKLVEGTGDNKYSPVAPMTRGSLATVLHRLSQGKTDYEVTFKDVAEGKYYTEGVAWAAKANVVKGVSEDVFAPDQIITREQLAVMLARYAKLVGLNTKADAKALEAFTDGDTTGAWAVDGMAWCVEQGILKGKGQNNLDPTADVTRAEVAVMLDRFIALLK